MILDLGRFTDLERPLWEEFETILARFERDSTATMTIEEIARFHYLYQRSSSDLVRMATFSADPEHAGVSGVACRARLRRNQRAGLYSLAVPPF